MPCRRPHDKGAVTIDIDRQEIGARRLSHGKLEAGAYVRVTVTDNGCGMGEAQRAKMFQPFFTTREGGTGLGLATARDTVGEIGGAFEVRSALGEGTRVEIWLPEIHGAQRDGRTSGTVLLLGVDRDSVRRDEDLLAALGYEPVGFTDTASALQALRDEVRRFDVAIVDQMAVPQGRGDLIRSLRTALPRGRPLILSLTEEERDTVFDTPLGVSGVLKRPWRSTAVAATLAQAATGGHT